ncbi:MAG: PAS domain S-box protein, partial [Pseudomonadota bacterium]
MPKPRAGLFPSNLKMRIASLVVVLVLGATILVTTVALMVAERDMKSVIGDQQYAMLSSAAAFIDDRLDSKKVLLASLAEALPERVRSNPALLQEFLESHPSTLNEFVNVAGFDGEGQMVASLRAPQQQAQAMSARGKPYFEDTLARKKGLISAPFMSRMSGSPVVLVTQPVFNSTGKVVLVLTAGIDLQRANFLRQIDTLKPGKSGFLFIMTYGGILVDHPTQSRLLEHINARPGVNTATEMALKGFEGWTEARNKDGSPGIYTYKRLKATDWILAARYPTDEAFAPMIAMRSQAILAAAACALLAGLLGWLAIYRLLGPLEFLRRSVSKIRRKQADIGVLQVVRSDEIGELSHAFHALMAEREVAQARTLESEQLVRNILDRAPDAFVTLDEKGNITEWNHQAEETFGWTREEAVGASLARLIVPERYRAAHNEGFACFATTGTGPVINNRIRVGAMHRDGREIPGELSVGAVAHGKVDYATAFLHDVSERVAFEEQITASVRRARIIADTMPALISYVDAEQRYR